MPLVSIILPTYNGNHNWLSESIDSVLSQSFSDFELIIINDCSTNDIEKTILEYKKKDNRIVYIKNEQNLRLTKTLNKGIDLARGKYIARIDDDDIWCDKDKLKKQVEFMENNPEYGLCGGSGINIDEKGNNIDKIDMIENDLEIRDKILSGPKFYHSSVLFKKEILDSIGKYSEKWDYIEDHELWLRIGLSYSFFNFKDYFIKYRIRKNSISRKNKIKQEFANLKVIKLYKNKYPNANRAKIYIIINLILDYIRKLFKKTH